MKANKKAVSLIVLVLTIIVISILAGVIFISLRNTDIIDRASEAAFKTDMKNIKQAVTMEMLDSQMSGRRPNYNNIIPDSYKGRIIVLDDGTIFYICDVNGDEASIVREFGIKIIDVTVKTVSDIVRSIEDATKDYIVSTNSTKDINLLVTQYIRNLTYNSTMWTTVAGTVDTNFVQYVNEYIRMTTEQVKNKIKTLKDPASGKDVDFIHAIASLNGYLYNKESSETIRALAEYSAWAGDLCTLMEQVVNYAKGKSYKSPYTEQAKQDIEKYIDDILGTDSPVTTFGISDMMADADATAIYVKLENGQAISDIIYNYYIGKLECKDRYILFADYLTNLSKTNSSIGTVTKVTEDKAKAAYLFMGKTNLLYTGYASAITSFETISALSDELCTIISNKFSKYVDDRI